MPEMNFPSIYGGMNNILQSNKLSNEQCELIENVEYFEKEKQFKGSKEFIKLNLKYNFNKIYKVYIDNKEHLIVTHSLGYYDITENKDYSFGFKIDNVLSNEDGLYFNSGKYLYNFKDGNLIQIYSKSFEPKTYLETTSVKFNSIAYFNGSLYFSLNSDVYIRVFDPDKSSYAIKKIYTIPKSDNGSNLRTYLFVYNNKLYLISYFSFHIITKKDKYYMSNSKLVNLSQLVGVNIFYEIHITSKDNVIPNGNFYGINFNGIYNNEFIQPSIVLERVKNNNLSHLYVFENNTFKKSDNEFSKTYNNSNSTLKELNIDTGVVSIGESTGDGSYPTYKDYSYFNVKFNKINTKLPFYINSTIFMSYYKSIPMVITSAINNNSPYTSFKTITNEIVYTYIPPLTSTSYFLKAFVFDIKHPFGRLYEISFVIIVEFSFMFSDKYKFKLYVYNKSNDTYTALLSNFTLIELEFANSGNTINVNNYINNSDYINIHKISDYEFMLISDGNYIYFNFFKNLISEKISLQYKKISEIPSENNKYYLSCYSEETNTLYSFDVSNNKLYKYNTSFFGDNIQFLLIYNGRLIFSNYKTLYYSSVGDFTDFSSGTDGQALFLEVGYKDGGNIINAAISYGNIICFKDNGAVYKVSGDYPDWVVTKIADTDNLTSNIFNYNGSLIFGTTTGLKILNPSQNYGDFIISDFQNNIITSTITNISLSEKRKSLVFCSEDYVFEYNIRFNIFYVYQSSVYKNYLEYQLKDLSFSDYAVDSIGNLYQSTTDLNTVTVTRNLISHQNDIIIRSITLFTNEIEVDTEITIYLYGDISFKRVLKKGQTKHKIFITKRLRQFQLKYIHAGSIFIENIIVEYDNVKGV